MTTIIKKKNKIYPQDIFYMKHAIQLAKKGKYTTDPNPNVGCIIVNKKKIVGIGWHIQAGKNHAEINAINMAGQLAKEGTAYISLEPCNHFGKTPPCCHAIIQSGIKRVVIAMIDPNPQVSGKGIKCLKQAGIQVTTGVLEQESKKINRGFLKRITTGLPWIQIKLAISLDAKTAMQNGNSKWITSHHARKDVHKFRALSSAILSTSKSVLFDNPLLTVRYEINKFIKKQPIRIIIDSKNRIKPYHKFIHEKGEIWLIRLKKDNEIWPNYVKQILISSKKNKINLMKLFYLLGEKQINTLWIESGSTLSSQILNLGITDELILYIAPKMLGQFGKPVYISNTNIQLNQAPELIFKNIKYIGSDVRMILQPCFKEIFKKK